VFKVAIAEKPTGWFMIRNRKRVVKRHPEGRLVRRKAMAQIWAVAGSVYPYLR
jgi:hypothetical protein